MGKLTLEEIGQMAGVSRSTVSRVVNHDRRVRPEVRARVLEVIAHTGYQPHAAARSLASNRTDVIGLVIPHRVHTLFDDPYFARLIQGISSACNLAGVTLALYVCQTEEEEVALYPRVASAGTVDGIVLTATRVGDPLVHRLQEGQVPLVVVGRPDDEETISYVDVDNAGGARLAVRHLVGLGHETVACVGAPSSTTTGQDRRRGFIEGLAECGRLFDKDLYYEGDYSEQSGYDGMRELLPQRPTAVFVATDTMALGALRALREADMAVPGDVAVVGFDGLPPSERATPALTTVRQPVTQTGARATEMLLANIKHGSSVPTREILPVELVVRESCGGPEAANGRHGR